MLDQNTLRDILRLYVQDRYVHMNTSVPAISDKALAKMLGHQENIGHWLLETSYNQTEDALQELIYAALRVALEYVGHAAEDAQDDRAAHIADEILEDDDGIPNLGTLKAAKQHLIGLARLT